MGDNNMEQTPQAGAIGQPPSPTSPTGATTSAVDVKALADALKPYIDEAVERKAQSGKDKRIAKLQGTVDGFAEQLTEFQQWKALNKSDDEALLLMQMRRSLQGQEPVEVQGGAAPQPAQPGVDTRTILLATQLDENDPQVGQLVRRGAGVGDYIALAAQRRSQPAPSPAAVMPVSSGQTVPQDDLKALYDKEVGVPGLTVNERLAIRLDFRRRGLAI